jgi:hypothetical protein
MKARNFLIGSAGFVVVVVLAGCPDGCSKQSKNPVHVARDRAIELEKHPRLTEAEKGTLFAHRTMLGLADNNINRDENEVNNKITALNEKIAVIEQRLQQGSQAPVESQPPVEMKYYYVVQITEDNSSIGGRIIDSGKPSYAKMEVRKLEDWERNYPNGWNSTQRRTIKRVSNDLFTDDAEINRFVQQLTHPGR